MTEKSPAFLKILKEVEKNYPGRMTLASEAKEPFRIRTPSFQINRLLGGGLPANRLNLICGYTKSFKSTFVLGTLQNLLSLCGECYKIQPLCTCKKFNTDTNVVYIDVDQTMDRNYVQRFGIDGDRIHIFQPPHGEAALEIAERFSQIPEVRGIVIDTLAALVPIGNLVDENSKKGYLDSMQMGDRAKLANRICRAFVTHLNSPIPKLAIMVNHVMRSLDRNGGTYLPAGIMQENLSTVVLQFWAQGTSATKQTVDDQLAEKSGKVHKEEVGFIIRKSKIGRWNISGEFQIYTEGDPKIGIVAGTSADWESVADWGVKYGLVDKVSGKSEDGGKFKYLVGGDELGPRQLAKYWREHPTEYIKLQEEIIQNEISSKSW